MFGKLFGSLFGRKSQEWPKAEALPEDGYDTWEPLVVSTGEWQPVKNESYSADLEKAFGLASGSLGKRDNYVAPAPSAEMAASWVKEARSVVDVGREIGYLPRHVEEFYVNGIAMIEASYPQQKAEEANVAN